MSWIKDNLFGVALGGITAVAAGGLAYWGFQGSTRIDTASARFQAAADEVSTLSRAPLSPSAANRDGKRKAIGDYRVSVASLQEKFLVFRPKEIVNIPPSDFGTRLLEISGKARKSLETAGVKCPPNALGLEQYTSKPAEQGATGILSYQVSAAAALADMLAEARPSAIINIHRPQLVEETGGKYTPAENEVARPLPMELTFRGSERAAREFFEKLANDKQYFFVVRSLRVSNQNKKGPTAAEAKFAPNKPSAGLDSPFPGTDGGDFVLPPDLPAADGDKDKKPAASPVKPAVKPGGRPALPPAAAPVAPAPAPAPAAPAAPRASRQILKQMVGNEELTVWLRLDVLLFHDGIALPGAEPKP